MKVVKRFWRKGKLIHWYIGRYEITKHVGDISYELDLPSELTVLSNFLCMNGKKCIRDPSLLVPKERNGVKDSLSYDEIPIEILD